MHFNARMVGTKDDKDDPGAGEAGDDDQQDEDDDDVGDAGGTGKSRHSFGSARGLTGVGWDKQQTTAGKKRRRATVPFTGASGHNTALYSDSENDSGYDTEAQKRRF